MFGLLPEGCGNVSDWGLMQIGWVNASRRRNEPRESRHDSCLHNKEWPHENQYQGHKDHRSAREGERRHCITLIPHSSCALNTEYSHLVSSPSAHVGVIKSSIKAPSIVRSRMAACLPCSLLAFCSPFQPIQWNINSISDKRSLSYNTFLTSFCSRSGCIKKSCNICQWITESLLNPDIYMLSTRFLKYKGYRHTH